MNLKSQNSNMLLAFLTLLGIVAIVALVGFFMLRKGPEIVQGQAEVTEYRVSSKVPGRIQRFLVKEGQSVQAGDTLAITSTCRRSRRTGTKRKSTERRKA